MQAKLPLSHLWTALLTVLAVGLFARPARGECSHAPTASTGSTVRLLQPILIERSDSPDSNRPGGRESPPCFRCGSGSHGLPPSSPSTVPPSDLLMHDAGSRHQPAWTLLLTPRTPEYSHDSLGGIERPPRETLPDRR
jgi:hypothetical protein